MALSTAVLQLQKVLETSKHVLVVFSVQNNGEAIAGAMALKYFLEKQHKQVDVVANDFVLPKQMKFLPMSDQIKTELAHLQKFIIKVDVSKAKIETISYDVKDDWLSIYLTPKTGTITKNELRTAQSIFKYDAIIILNSPDLESLGEIFDNNTDLFYRTPLINIDRHPHNEHFGQINLVDITATSSAEILYQIFQQLDETAIDGDTATALLAGMIVATKSFKTPNVTPYTLNLASQLIKLGGDREKIIKNLYRTRSINTLKLWGEALTRLQSDPVAGLVWTTITREDLARSGATTEDLKGVVDELITNSPETELVILFYEIPEGGEVRVMLTAEKNRDAKELARQWGGEGNRRQATFTLANKTLREAEEEIINALREKIKN